MISNYKQSCTKITIDFNKLYTTQTQCINLLGNNCIFCNSLTYGDSFDGGCANCGYYIRFDNKRIYMVQYRRYDVSLNNDNIISIQSQKTHTIHHINSTIIDFQTLLNKINMLK